MRKDKHSSSIPVIMITAKGEESDVVVGLSLGADDYVIKPFRVKELMARIKVRLHRVHENERKQLKIKGLIIDPTGHRVLVDDEPAALTATEFKLLFFLASHPDVVYGRYDLLERVGDGESVVTDRTIDVHVRNLRMKIKPYGHLIETVRGAGYRFAEAAE